VFLPGQCSSCAFRWLAATCQLPTVLVEGCYTWEYYKWVVQGEGRVAVLLGATRHLAMPENRAPNALELARLWQRSTELVPKGESKSPVLEHTCTGLAAAPTDITDGYHH
jgi:hypothetical protein